MAFKDRRRTDARDSLQGQTFWITSKEIDVAEVGGAGSVVLFSFPNPNETYIIDLCALDVITDLNAGTVNIGHGTLPLDTTAESGILTTTTADSLWASATANETSGTVFSIDDQTAAPLVLVGAAATVPVIIATVATAISGKFRVHARITAIPSY